MFEMFRKFSEVKRKPFFNWGIPKNKKISKLFQIEFINE